MKRPATALLLLALCAPGLAAQRTPIQDLLVRARNALNNLEYSDADRMGRGVLAFGAQVSRDERIEALQIVSAALYPEETQAQRRDSAVNFLRQLVRLAPDRDIPRGISWRGLDSLLAQIKRTTFGAVARPQRENQVVGVNPDAGIPINTSKTARFYLAAVPATAGARPVVIDSAGPGTQGFLRLRLIHENQLRLPSGRYELRVMAIDAAAPDTITIRYNATVNAPVPSLVPILALDTTQLRPEMMPPSRGRNIAIGVGAGAATVLLAQLFRAGDPVKSQASADSKAFVAGGVITLGAIFAGTRDRGTPQPRNVAWNAQVRAQHQQAVTTAQDENGRRLASYRATVTIDLEAR